MSFVRRNPDLAAAALLALVTACFSEVSLSSLRESINFPLLALLFSLMTIVAALRRAGFFSGLFCHLFQKPMNSRRMGQVFLFLSFFTSMVFTNDVSLIIFVPLAISLFKEAHALRLVIPVLTWMTIAANLGSMLTPIGNPSPSSLPSCSSLPAIRWKIGRSCSASQSRQAYRVFASRSCSFSLRCAS